LTSISSSPRENLLWSRVGPSGGAPRQQGHPGEVPRRPPRQMAGNRFRFHQLAWCALSKNQREPPVRALLPTSQP